VTAGHRAEAATQWLKDCIGPKLVKGECVSFRSEGRAGHHIGVGPKVYALNDHIHPPNCAQALRGHVRHSQRYPKSDTGGHGRLFVSSKSQGV